MGNQHGAIFPPYTLAEKVKLSGIYDYIATEIAAAVAGGLNYQGGYDANANTPDLEAPAGGAVSEGYMYTVTVAGTFFTEDLEVGDVIIAEQDDPAALADWTVLQTNLFDASGNLTISGDILDSNGDELINFTSDTTPVNEIGIDNADTGVDPKISATGDDADIGIELEVKGDDSIILTSTSLTAAVLAIAATQTTGDSVTIANDVLTTGTALSISSDSADASARALVDILNDNAAAIGTTILQLRDDSTGVGLAISGTTGILATLTRTSSGQFLSLNDGTDIFGIYNNAGTPEGVVTANIGSYCIDTTNGTFYVKTTADATNTNWVQLQPVLAEGVFADGDKTLLDALGTEETDDTLQAKRIARAVWDHGAGLTAAGSPYTFGPSLPDNAIVTRAWYHVVTTFTSGTDAAQIGLGVDADDSDGIVAPIAISDGTNPWDAGNHEGIQDGAAANFAEITTAARQFTGTLAAEDTTAGKLILFAEYVVAE